MRYFVFRNQTVEPFFSGEEVTFSGYDDVSQVPTDASRYIWFYQVPVGPINEVADEVDTYFEKLQFVASRCGADKQLIVFSLVDTANVLIVENDRALRRAINDFNRQVSQWAETRSNVKLIDFSEFTECYPCEQLVNWKFYFISQTLLNPKLARDFGQWWQNKERALDLKRKKCLVLDLDNTLWGGILGEDGPAGIKIGGDYPGKAFSYWQRALLELKNTGVMLAVCSKNDEKDVMEVWERNPFMVLRKDDFVAWRINWQDKATNVQELASELNIGLDSMVFVDDNPAERELIRQMLPMVTVPDFPTRPYELMSFVKDLVDSYFSVYSITVEDVSKTAQYKANAARQAEQTRFATMDDYLQSLELCLQVSELDKFNLARLAQMTQKTNQFNLTTKRYTEDDLQRMASQGARIFGVSVSDRFGDNGITGELILCPLDATTAEIDTLLLSCRILGRGIEFAFLNSVLNLLLSNGVKSVHGTYIPTAKNGQVASFYEEAGFSLVKTDNDGRKYYVRKIDTVIDNKDYYKIIIHKNGGENT
ncbi:MAG: HAD-IIIC family phosphatase [Muribaculaceae bacterium]|nr:HAD-IIIC family phosphatase [Muribaculaceae bacterium]